MSVGLIKSIYSLYKMVTPLSYGYMVLKYLDVHKKIKNIKLVDTHADMNDERFEDIRSDMEWVLTGFTEDREFIGLDNDTIDELKKKWSKDNLWRRPKKYIPSKEQKKAIDAIAAMKNLKPKVSFAEFLKNFKEQNDTNKSEVLS